MNLSLCCLQLLCFHLIPIFQPRVDIREWRRWGFIECYYQLSFLVSKSRAYKAAAMGICCIAIEELRKELISLLSRLDHIYVISSLYTSFQTMKGTRLLDVRRARSRRGLRFLVQGKRKLPIGARLLRTFRCSTLRTFRCSTVKERERRGEDA